MAKIKKSLQKISGKMDGKVYVDSKAYGPYVKNPVKPGSKKGEPAFNKELSRTVLLNSVGSDVNNIVASHAEILKPKTFYKELHVLFRKEPENNRLMLLKKLAGMEVNPAYPFKKLGGCTYSSKHSKTSITITLNTELMPARGDYHADCFYYAVILAQWGGRSGRYSAETQYSEWVGLKEKKPVFEFEFKRTPAGKQWLLMVHIVLGKKEQRIESLTAEGMQIMDAGSFDKKDLELLKKQKVSEKKELMKRREVVEVVRVKRKG